MIRPALAALLLTLAAACGPAGGGDGMVGDTPVGEDGREDAGADENDDADAP